MDADIEDDDGLAALDERADLLAARRWFAIAVAGAVMAPIGFGGKANFHTFLALAGVALTCIAGWNGFEKLVRAGGASAGWKLVAPLAFFPPYISFLALAWLLWTSHARLSALEEQERGRAARAAARERAARRTAAAQAAPGAAPAAAASPNPQDVQHAIATIKHAVPDQDDLTVLRMKTSEGDLPPGQMPFGMAYKGFAVFFLIDEGRHFRYANKDDLAAANMTHQALLQAGLRNLAKRVNGAPGLSMGRNSAINALLMGGHFEASLLLLDDLWDGPLKAQAPGGAVVAIPARDICAFCDAASAQGVRELRALAAGTMARGDHAITETLFIRRNRRWEVFA